LNDTPREVAGYIETIPREVCHRWRERRENEASDETDQKTFDCHADCSLAAGYAVARMAINADSPATRKERVK